MPWMTGILCSRRKYIWILLAIALITLISVALHYIAKIQSILDWRCSDWRISLLLLLFNSFRSKILQVPSTTIPSFEILYYICHILRLSYCIKSRLHIHGSFHWVIKDIRIFLNFHNLLLSQVVSIFQPWRHFELSFRILYSIYTLICYCCYFRSSHMWKQEIVLACIVYNYRVFV